MGYRFDDAGTAEVSIDDKVVGTVDQYGPGRNLPFQWSQKNLARRDTIPRLRLLSEKLPQSRTISSMWPALNMLILPQTDMAS